MVDTGSGRGAGRRVQLAHPVNAAWDHVRVEGVCHEIVINVRGAMEPWSQQVQVQVWSRHQDVDLVGSSRMRGGVPLQHP
jgi:hypothetical protein